ncbi:MAG: carbohydrate ABC transporter permease [Planctomycetota bacterium]|nr:carbohydrate ABC transporter permease [Planctomycetota bacterium]
MRRAVIPVLLRTLIAAAVALLFIAPLLWMLAGSFKPDAAVHDDVQSLRSFVPSPFTLENYAEAARRTQLADTMLNTALVVLLVAVGGLLVNAPAAYAFARLRFPGREALFLLLVSTIIIPIEVIVIPLFMTVRTTRGIAEVVGERPWTIAALSVPFMAKAFNIFLLRQYFLTLPRSLEEAAYVDGAGVWRAFWRIALPNAAPALGTVILLDLVIHWNDFLWPLVICQGERSRTIQLGLANFFTQPPISWGSILAYAVIATIPLALAFLIGQRWIVQSLAGTGRRG